MERKEFIKLVGISSVTIFAISCIESCNKKSKTPTTDFTIDLSQNANASLIKNGGYLVKNGIIIAKTIAGNYIAVSATCNHAGATIYYDSTADNFRCPNHGATFSDSGKVTNGPATQNLTTYNTALSGNSLRIFS